jgi:hypothetical protein
LPYLGFKIVGNTGPDNTGTACVTSTALTHNSQCHIGADTGFIGTGSDVLMCNDGTLTWDTTNGASLFAVSGCDGAGYFETSGSIANADLSCTACTTVANAATVTCTSASDSQRQLVVLDSGRMVTVVPLVLPLLVPLLSHVLLHLTV